MLTHKPTFKDAVALFNFIIGVLVLTVKTINATCLCGVASVGALDTCQKLVRCLVTVVFATAWFAPAEYVSLAYFGFMRINHVYARGSRL